MTNLPQQYSQLRADRCGSALLGRLWMFALIAVLLTVFGKVNLTAQDSELEYKVKAAFLFNFLKFTEFPTNRFKAPEDAFVVACLSEDPAAPILSAALEGKSIDGRPIHAVRFKPGDDMRRCHLLFISRTRKAPGDDLLERLKRAPVLTVGEVDQFAENGGMINFVRHERTFRFEVNLETAEQAGLRISSKLASMATIVKTPSPK